ncbi:MAG: cation:proton antiporter regulatory subunit [Actinomycetota bacterium]|nr:cation:proton antiporter regulatory subunit [Actinomycetota bacterium]
MTDIEETALPGVGLRYEFLSKDGERVGVIHHRTGRRELFIAEASDPDACRESLRLDEDESRTLAELLGGSRIIEHLTDLQQSVEGLAIDWLSIGGGSPYSGRSIGDTRVRTRTGVSVVAVLRGEDAFPAPGPGFRLEGGDVLVVVGTSEGIEAVSELLRTG